MNATWQRPYQKAQKSRNLDAIHNKRQWKWRLRSRVDKDQKIFEETRPQVGFDLGPDVIESEDLREWVLGRKPCAKIMPYALIVGIYREDLKKKELFGSTSITSPH
jgi:hypothetical protein